MFGKCIWEQIGTPMNSGLIPGLSPKCQTQREYLNSTWQVHLALQNQYGWYSNSTPLPSLFFFLPDLPFHSMMLYIVINFSHNLWLKPTRNIPFLHRIFESEIWKQPAEWFWLQISHEFVVKMLARLTVNWRFSTVLLGAVPRWLIHMDGRSVLTVWERSQFLFPWNWPGAA